MAHPEAYILRKEGFINLHIYKAFSPSPILSYREKSHQPSTIFSRSLFQPAFLFLIPIGLDLVIFSQDHPAYPLFKGVDLVPDPPTWQPLFSLFRELVLTPWLLSVLSQGTLLPCLALKEDPHPWSSPPAIALYLRN